MSSLGYPIQNQFFGTSSEPLHPHEKIRTVSVLCNYGMIVAIMAGAAALAIAIFFSKDFFAIGFILFLVFMAVALFALAAALILES